MTVDQKLDNLYETYIKWSHKNEPLILDPGYIWWERVQACQEWSTKKRTFIPMSTTKTLRIMRDWVRNRNC